MTQETRSLLITGASSGIGRATAEMFLDAGWQVGLVARRADRLEEMAASHAKAIALPADVTDAEAMRAAFDRFIDQTGRLDVLFNNAGIFGPMGPIDEVPLDGLDQVLNVNIRGMFIAAQLAFGQMRRQDPKGGRIINNGSISAHSPRPGSTCYTLSKHAITGLTRSLYLDGRAHGIACGQIDIGNAESEIVSDLKSHQPDMATMDVAHAARSVLHMADMPLSAHVPFMTVMATQMPYIGRG
ncbi:SDR family oxidoreductase [Roseovarius nubinhibens]|uniref:Oxidoreductase, short chain dehydrogenase/reductase family protein n=1 Tax=Roseovarius nubinhibens (strain ATCC BAA-591 / DSM 15170 / ISM) TaxID=89187 RepID=A3SKG0_ROSNI|nr:SDR family oxidoreductase [Roseovarius nubinhibens]EAP77841.1 oxidoreductase, short chain dehydrogenase/reductase family protein [Roseovarius nubinhibens ISM]